LTDRTYRKVPDLAQLKTSPSSGATRVGPSASPIEVGSEWPAGGLAVVTVRGEVDAFSAGILRRELLTVVAAGARVVVVDLDATTFMDSVTLGVLLGTLRRLQSSGGELRIACANGPIRRTFELTQLVRVLPVYGCVADALSASPGHA
jgi:anti-sigma B factor antagonist